MFGRRKGTNEKLIGTRYNNIFAHICMDVNETIFCMLTINLKING